VVDYQWQCPVGYLQPNFNYPIYQSPIVYPPTIIDPMPPITPVNPTYQCWDGSVVYNLSLCPAQYQTCWDGSKIPVNQTCPSQYKNCPDGSVVLTTQQCPSLPQITCWDGSKVYNIAYCPVQYKTCWDGSKVTDLSQCPTQYKTCPDGSKVLISQECPQYQTCWDGSKVLVGQVCPTQYQTCWDGSKIPVNQTCPAQYQTCWDGSKIPVNQTCPSQYKNCPDGSVVLTTQQCPTPKLVNCWDGTRAIDISYCPPQYKTCPDGTKVLVNQECTTYKICWDGSRVTDMTYCPPQYKTCPDGARIPVNQECTIYQTCWDGSKIPMNQVCPIRTQTCPNGQVIPITQTCPTQTQTCWNGLVIPVSQTCPAQYQTCWDGSIVPVNQSCPTKTQTTVIVKKVEVREHTVITNLATKVTKNSAQCNAVGLIVDGVSSVGWFEYGETVDVNKNTNSASIGGAPEASFSNIITGLKPDTTYYCRAVMANKDGTYKGKVVSFKTLGDTKITYPAPKAPTKQAPKTKTEFVCADGSIAVARTVLVGETINAGGKLLKVNIERNVPELIQGNVLNYRVTVENISDIAVSGVEIKIVLPGEMSFVDVVTTGGVMVQDNIMTIPLNSINAEEVKTLIIPVKVSSEALVGKTVVSTVYVSYNLPVEGSQIVRDEVSAYMIANIVGVDGKDVSSSKSFISKIFPQTLLGWLVFFAVVLILVVLIMNILKWIADRKKEKEEEVIHHHIS